jgi:hypothetical protein
MAQKKKVVTKKAKPDKCLADEPIIKALVKDGQENFEAIAALEARIDRIVKAACSAKPITKDM